MKKKILHCKCKNPVPCTCNEVDPYHCADCGRPILKVSDKKKFTSMLKENEVLGCVKRGNKLYWKKLRFKTIEDVKYGWPYLLRGLEVRLRKLGVPQGIPKKDTTFGDAIKQGKLKVTVVKTRNFLCPECGNGFTTIEKSIDCHQCKIPCKEQ